MTRWWFLGAIAVTLGVAAGIWLRLRPHHRERLAVAMPGGAFLTGGVPGRDRELERVLGEQLPELVRDTDEDTHGVSAAAERRLADAAALRAEPIMAAFGPGLAAAWAQLLDALDGWDRASSKRHLAELRAAAHAVSEQLAALGLGYHLEANALGDHAIVFSFEVTEVAYEHAGDATVRVLSLRRIDRLNVTPTLLGMQTDDGADPVVMLDAIDDLIDHKLGDPTWFPLGDDAWAHSPDGRRVGAAAGAAIGKELDRLGPDRFGRALVATVRRHEARHAVDIALDDPLPYPPALARYVHDAGALTVRARAELTAYVCQIGSDPETPQLALWNLATIGFNAEHRGAAESFVAAVVIEGLARHLGVRGSDVSAIRDGSVDRRHLAQLAVPLAALSDAALRDAARELWVDLYHTPFEPIRDTSATIGS